MPNNKWYIDEYTKKQEAKANKALNVIGSFIVGDAKLRVAVDSGNLKNSIVKVLQHLSVLVGTAVEYALHIEKGTENFDAMPYLEPALMENEKIIQETFVRIMRK